MGLTRPSCTDRSSRTSTSARSAQRWKSQVIIRVQHVTHRPSSGGSDVRRPSGLVWDGCVADGIELGASPGPGELLRQSVDWDGAGVGLNVLLVRDHGPALGKPLILMGGVGRVEHIVEGLGRPAVDAVVTASPFGFVGDALSRARMEMIAACLAVSRPPAESLAGLRRAALQPMT